jgi:signal transduction histidine kinase
LSDNIQEILHAGRYLLELINDVLDLSKIEAGNYELDMKAVSISKIINATLNLLQAQATDKKVTLSSKVTEDNDLQIYADARSLKQIMINLIYNAIKYNHPGGSVDVSIEKQTNGICKISVTDTGDGIAEDAQQRIFDPFQRVTNRTDIEGTGVGLAIVDSLVKIMGGRITLESTPGKGSTFSVFFTIA